MIEFHGLVLLTSANLIGIDDGEDIQQAGGNNKFGPVIGCVACDVRRTVAQEDGREVENAGSHIAEIAAELNEARKNITIVNRVKQWTAHRRTYQECHQDRGKDDSGAPFAA